MKTQRRLLVLLSLAGLLCSCAAKSEEAEIQDFVKGDWLMVIGAGSSHAVRFDYSAVVDRKSSLVLLRLNWKTGGIVEYTILFTAPQRTFQAKVAAKTDGSAMWFTNPSTGETLVSFNRTK